MWRDDKTTAETKVGIHRLGIPYYYFGNEALHGVVRPGTFGATSAAIWVERG